MNTSRPIVMASEQSISICARKDIDNALSTSFGSAGLVLTEAELSPEFFALRSGLAGELFQKFTNYQLPVALVIADFSGHGERFAELAHEHASHPSIRFVHSVPEALAWLQARPED